jgi:RimJ/RimL family protein N-acetyltransferase
MEIRLHDDPAEFAALARPLYAADPVMHTVALTVLALPHEYSALLTVHAHGAVLGAAFRDPPWPLVVSGLPEVAAGRAADALVDADPGLDAVVGPRPRAEAFAAAWCAATGATAHTVLDQRLFGLGELTEPTGVPGAARIAGEPDLTLAWRWRHEFVAEAGPHAPAPTEDVLRMRMRAGNATVFWEVDGEPVAMAGVSAPTTGMSRVGPVYTPPERRGHGYGSAVTAAASRWALDAGARRVVLFTDLANPISNAIYPRIGYRPVHDAVHLGFTGAGR